MSAIHSSQITFFTAFSPFNRMEQAHLQWMLERMQLSYYAAGEIVISPDQSKVEQFYVIKQGLVYGEQDLAKVTEEDSWLELSEGECFPLGAILAGLPVASIYRAGQDTFCYELPINDFNTLLGMSAPFRDFCTRRIANLLEHSKQVIQAQYTQSGAGQQSLTSPLSSIIRRPPITCSAETSVRNVLEKMKELRLGSMIAVDNEGRPLGIMTLPDVLSRIALPQSDLDQPVINVMTTQLTAMDPHVLAQEAALLMAKEGIRHVLVVDNEKLVGVVSEKDLFALQRVGLVQIGTTIRQANQIEELQQTASDIRSMAHNMMAQGVAAEHLTQFISAFNDLLTARIIELELAKISSDSIAASCNFCWLALGSEGRLEQTLNTDQDNALIFSVPEGFTADQVRADFLPIALRINETLALCGFPLCKGKIMASNPQWCLSLDEWKRTFTSWITHSTQESLLNSSIFFDFRALFGDKSLADKLREWLLNIASDNGRFLRQLAEAAMNFRPPLGVVRDFVVGKEKKLDLKLNGITPFVNTARIFSLANGIPSSGTLQRLRASGSKMNIPEAEIEAWIDSFLFIQVLRLRHHDEEKAKGISDDALDNLIDPEQLNELDRRILKEAFRQARKLQARLSLEYRL
jgi:CBS domain-containing protein